jgi:DNA-binding CsgD family transcriptional regulator
MSTPLRASEHDLRALAAIVSQDRPDLPDGEGLLPRSLLADLMAQIPCDAISVEHCDTRSQVHRWLQGIDDSDDGDDELPEDWEQVFWTHYWDCLFCTHPVLTGDLRSVVRTSDLYSTRQWHGTGMYIDCIRPQGIEHHLGLALPDLAETTGHERYLRLVLHRAPGPDFSDRDRALLVLLRPHLYQAYLDAEHRRHPVPRLTPRQNDLLRLLAAGHTNTKIARQLGISEGTVRTHLENIYEKLGVSSRTAAVTRAFPDLVASSRTSA